MAKSLKTDKNYLYLYRVGAKKIEQSRENYVALYIPTSVRDALPFHRSVAYPKLRISYNYTQLLHAVMNNWGVAYRHKPNKNGELPLEKDIKKQQLIGYCIVTIDDKVLLYKRPSNTDVSVKKVGKLGDERLRGMYSIGIGGHIDDTDIREAHLFTTSLSPLLAPIIQNESPFVTSVIGALLREARDELGIENSDIAKVTILGAFYEEFAKKETKGPSLPVASVHTGICAWMQLDTDQLGDRPLRLSREEAATAELVPINKLQDTLYTLELEGKIIEDWTRFVMAEFFPQIRSSLNPPNSVGFEL